jgi:hypothetical protein
VTGSDFAVGLIALAIGITGMVAALYAPRSARVRTVIDGIPAYTTVTEQDDSWLAELPAIPSDQER